MRDVRVATMIRSAARRGVAAGRLPTIERMRILIANDDGYLAPGLAALVERLRRARRARRRRAGAERERHLELADAEPRRCRCTRAGQRLSLHQRHAVRLRPRRAHRPARAAPRPGRLRHQQRRQHGRRHALFGHGRRGHGRLPVRHSGDRLLAGPEGLGAPRCRGARRAQRHRARAARAAGARAAGCSTSTSRTAPMPIALPRRDHPPRPPPCERAGDPPDQPARRHASTGSARPATRARPARAPTSTPRRNGAGLDHAAAGRPHRPRRAAGLARLARPGAAMTSRAARAPKFPLAPRPRSRGWRRAGRRRRSALRRCRAARVAAAAPRAPRRTPTPAARAARPASGSTRPACAQRMVERLRRDGVRHAARARRAGRGAAPSASSTAALATQAYEDTSLPIGHGQTISKPSVVARMIELLFGGATRAPAARSARVLEIGTGCGYQAALLAQLSRQVSVGRAPQAPARQGARAARAAARQPHPRSSTATACAAMRRTRPTTASSPPRAATSCRRPGSSSSPSAAAWSRRAAMPAARGRRWSSSTAPTRLRHDVLRGGALRPPKIRPRLTHDRRTDAGHASASAGRARGSARLRVRPARALVAACASHAAPRAGRGPRRRRRARPAAAAIGAGRGYAAGRAGQAAARRARTPASRATTPSSPATR